MSSYRTCSHPLPAKRSSAESERSKLVRSILAWLNPIDEVILRAASTKRAALGRQSKRYRHRLRDTLRDDPVTGMGFAWEKNSPIATADAVTLNSLSLTEDHLFPHAPTLWDNQCCYRFRSEFLHTGDKRSGSVGRTIAKAHPDRGAGGVHVKQEGPTLKSYKATKNFLPLRAESILAGNEKNVLIRRLLSRAETHEH